MAIKKKLIHFKTFEDFNSKKLSANDENTKYTQGTGGIVLSGSPDILYQSICWIKDARKMWTHGTLYDCTQLVSGTNIKTINGESILGSGDITISSTSDELNLVKIEYARLKEMRDNGDLSAGHLYRITDYEFTTVQANTKSAGHVFDIIVLATSANELSHIARAIAHDDDTYFDGNDLGVWELWYDLDNDTEKYEWADAENGKGVIYRMIDEKRNDCPYDFKNVLFFNEKLTTNTTEDKYYYTFSYVVSGVLYDGTVEKQVTNCNGNSMGVYIKSKKRSLNKNVWCNTTFGSYCRSNTFGSNCYGNTFGSYCHSNTFGSYCHSNTFGSNCHSNTFGSNCYGNTFGDNCHSNTFGYNCYSNTFGSNCYGNTFGDNCHSNTFGDSLSHREVDMDKTSITLNDEYYDDGSGQLVPIKHPDLSTQPSILPYKFMGQYVYEQLAPIALGGLSGTIIIDMAIDNPLILRAEAIGIGSYRSLHVTEYSSSSSTLYVEDFNWQDTSMLYIRVVYTSMPEDSSYYGY